MLSAAAASHGKAQLHPGWWAVRADLPEVAGLATFLLTSAFLLPRVPGAVVITVPGRSPAGQAHVTGRWLGALGPLGP